MDDIIGTKDMKDTSQRGASANNYLLSTNDREESRAWQNGLKKN